MYKILLADTRRLLHKKSLYIFLAALLVCYVVLTFIRSSTISAEALVAQVSMICGWSVTLAGGFIFAAIYTDDLSARTLSTLVALGYSKVKIVLGKFILTALVCAIAFAVAPLFFYAVHALFGCQASPSDLLTYYSYALSAFLTIVGFSQLAAICAYGIQRPTFAIVLYLLLSLGVIGGLISAALTTDAVQGIAPGINGFLLTSFANNASVSIIDASEAGAFAFLGCLIWYAVSIFASTFVFSKKEMEF